MTFLTHVCRIINEFRRFHMKNKIFLNIRKDYVFSFTKFCSLKQIFFVIIIFL